MSQGALGHLADVFTGYLRLAGTRCDISDIDNDVHALLLMMKNLLKASFLLERGLEVGLELPEKWRIYYEKSI